MALTSAGIAFLFPGQGSQYPGMGKDLFDEFEIVRDTYGEASEILGYDIAKLSFDDAGDQINLTRFTQPVLLTHSIACCRAFAEHTDNAISPNLAAGHSLGEYSALVCANSLSFALALQLVKTRGELMGEYGEGGMEALMIDLESAESLAERHYCGIAACNLPNQNVVGGPAEDLDALVSTMAEKFPGKRSARLKTEGAFHTYYMVEAARRFRQTLDQADFKSPQIDVLSNFTGGVHDTDINAIKSRLFLQLFNPVLWHKNLVTAGETGVEVMIEFGGGLGKGASAAEKRPNLESIVKKTFRGADSPPHYLSVINLATLQETVTSITTG
ncbi:ACP S-malonyltransferase [Candidatus Spongiihabitans sp.]|uniref:ACP S-malonyltransferase n=1 Tax=Candidatus Spongiihabitans sp. TaxID=3101308 RepID=UPI003C6FD64F